MLLWPKKIMWRDIHWCPSDKMSDYIVLIKLSLNFNDSELF